MGVQYWMNNNKQYLIIVLMVIMACTTTMLLVQIQPVQAARSDHWVNEHISPEISVVPFDHISPEISIAPFHDGGHDREFVNPYKWVGLLPPLSKEDAEEVKECWEPIDSVRNCHSEVIHSLWNEHINISSDCCYVVVSRVTTHCWRKMFELFPEFHRILFDYCIPPTGWW